MHSVELNSTPSFQPQQLKPFSKCKRNMNRKTKIHHHHTCSQIMSLLSAFFVVLLLLVYTDVDAAPKYLANLCGRDNKNETEYAPNTTFETNLKSVLSSLSTDTARGGFRNATARGTGVNASSNAVYGLALCRGDQGVSDCQNCILVATTHVAQSCNRVRSAVVWYEECMVRYSNDYIFSTLATDPDISMNAAGTIANVNSFIELLGETSDVVVSRATNDQTPPEKFAAEEKSYTRLQTLFMLAQCTPDLTAADCNLCLKTGFGKLPGYGSPGGRVSMPSCNIRYELYPFYNRTAVPPPSIIPSPPPGSTPIPPRGKKKTSPIKIIAIVVPVAGVGVLLLVGFCFLRSRAKKKYQSVAARRETGDDITTAESLHFGFSTIQTATGNFSEEKKLGEGGFGTVYKGTLPDGQEVAVKRLSRISSQAAEEFKNEVVLVAKLQHRNLVRLLGFCLQKEEKILVYEFAPNKSLDYFLFDPDKRGHLDWSRRYKIVGGIARGILYLHEDSRFRIIHRDLKAGNILLDEGMNAKISDFGTARIFGADQIEGNTSRIVGTYGYMSPEYVMHGHFSVKSDVFSFGVLVLEIVSGKKNSNFYQTDVAQDLLSHAWKLWEDGKPLELMDPTLGDTYSGNEVLQCIHIGLLCVQKDENVRPTMATVVLLLNSYSVTLPVPRQPAFFVRSGSERNYPIKDLDLHQPMPWSANEVSITELDPR